MKKFLAQMLAVLCALCLVLAVAGCSVSRNVETTPETTTENVTEPTQQATLPEETVTTPSTEETTPSTEVTTPDKGTTTTNKDTTTSNKDTSTTPSKPTTTTPTTPSTPSTETPTPSNPTPPSTEETTPDEDAAAALAAAKTTAKATLDAYADPADYRDAEKAQLAAAVANGKAAIEEAADNNAIEAALTAAKAVIDAIETDAQITAKSPTITTPITDGMVLTNNRATLDVIAKDASGKKLSYNKVTVTVNGIAATVNWDDSEKTSYNFVFEAGENTVIITAADGDYHTTVTYTVICDLEAATTITVSIEGFTVGLGYIVTPYKLTLDEATLTDMAGLYEYADAAEMKEKLSAAHCLDYTLYLHRLTMDYDGSLESTYNGFYMSSVSGIDTSCIEVPAELQEALEMNGYWVDPCVYDEGTLCEFDVTWGSGWMYTINNAYPNVPFCDYVPQDGDVMRIQFTLAYGADIGSTMVGDLWFESVDRDELTQLIADAIEAGVDYAEAFAVVSTFGVTQDELDEACEELRQRINA